MGRIGENGYQVGERLARSRVRFIRNLSSVNIGEIG